MNLDRTIPPDPNRGPYISSVKDCFKEIDELVKSRINLVLRQRLFYLKLYLMNYEDFYKAWVKHARQYPNDKYNFITEDQYQEFMDAFIELPDIAKLIDKVHKDVKLVTKGHSKIHYILHDETKTKEKDLERLHKHVDKLLRKLNHVVPKLRSNEDLMVSKSQKHGWKKHGPSEQVNKWRKQQERMAIGA